MTRQDHIFNKKVTAEWYQRAFIYWVRIGLTAALLIGAVLGFCFLLWVMIIIHEITNWF